MKKIIAFLLGLCLLFPLSGCFRVRVGQDAGAGAGAGDSDPIGETQRENVIGEEGGDVALLEGEYEKLLREGLGELYPCQFVLVYAEDEEDYLTFAPSSSMNALLLSCGGDSVTSAYLSLNLHVDDAFIAAHSPALIVKWVSGSVLGENISSTAVARAVQRGILSRDGIKDIPAVKTGNVLVLSKQLLESEGGKTLAKLFLARSMYPVLFPDIDLAAVSRELVGEGIFFYDGDEPSK